MSYRPFLFIFFVPFTLFAASCVKESRTETREGVLYVRKSKTPYEGCILRYYPDGQKKSELYYRKGKPTGEGNLWYANGQKESETVYRSGKIHTRRLWNREGYLYAFERYRDGVLLRPVEMDYKQAMDACRKATFDGYRDWKLPSVNELHRLPFSEATKERTYIASNRPKKGRTEEEVSYVRFGNTPATPRWDNDDLPISSTFNVVCVRKGNPRAFHLITGIDGIADLTSDAVARPAKATAPRPAPAAKKTPPLVPVAVKKSTIQKGLRAGYYITVYTFTRYPPEKTLLDNVLRSGYRYKFSELTKNGKTMTRVLVGPFPTRRKAAKELQRVQRKIEPDAYIIDNRY